MRISRLEAYFGYAETHRLVVCVIGGAMVALIAWADAQLPTMSIGFLYLVPILLTAAALNGLQIVVVAGLCAVLREAYDPLEWAPGAIGRMVAAAAGFAMAGFFVTGLHQRGRMLQKHLHDLEAEVRRRKDVESQIEALIETSPLAILTLDRMGRVALANDSARRLLEFGEESVQGAEVASYLPILPRMLQRHESGGNVRTNVECKARRRNGEMFLANVWVSTYLTSTGRGLAAVIWDASENLRDRERAGLDSMLATSRVLIGAMSHEIRNLASAAAAAYSGLTSPAREHGGGDATARSSQYEALGSLIRALESIASSGLSVAAKREPAVTDLGTVLDEARIVIDPMLAEGDFQVTWHVAEDLPLVQADQHSLLQVFINLGRNILTHAADAPEREATISAGAENDLVVVRFQDSGPGVANPDALFRPFQAGSQSGGLGLFVSRAIVRSHGGNLCYEPSEKGACFAVELWPVEKV
jgi:two-component system, LuxR family, sensor kinase FixL